MPAPDDVLGPEQSGPVPDLAAPRVFPLHHMSEHVLGRIGLHISSGEGPPRFDLHLGPIVLDPDGQVNFGVLGVYLDMAASQATGVPKNRPWVHADITVHRLASPVGRVLTSSARAARMGGRSGVIEIDVHDEVGTHVARSVQETVFTGPPRQPTQASGADRARLYALLHGDCSLDAPLYEVLNLTGHVDEHGSRYWTLPLHDLNRNGFGGLHGGSATALIDAAAAGLVAGEAGRVARTISAAVRYLAPGMVGPFRANPRVVARFGDTSLVVVEVRDTGADDKLTILADVHVTSTSSSVAPFSFSFSSSAVAPNSPPLA
jgi:uncharacterized protein (TIGR00369 family)